MRSEASAAARHTNGGYERASSVDVAPPPVPESSCTYAAWLFLCQVYALCWKQYLLKKRRPLSTLFEVLAPGLMMLILVYGTQLSPVVDIPAFVYSDVPVITSNVTLSPPSADPAAEQLVKFLEAAHLYEANNPVSYFQLAFLPLLSSPNATVSSQLTALMFANKAAAAPFPVPNFDSYISMMTAAKITMSQMGLKTLQHLDPLLWHVMNNGKIAFVPDTDEVASMIQYFTATTSSFQSLVLCGPSSVAPGCRGFTSTAAAEAAAYNNTVLWAVVVVNTLDAATAAFSYTIRINQTLVPDTSTVIDRFPQGLGQAYAQYIYSGFSTIQFELNEYFRRLSMQAAVLDGTISPPQMDFGVIPLFEAACNQIVSNATNMFTLPDASQSGLLAYLLSLPPKPQITVFPAPLPSAFYPCYAGVTGYCSSDTYNTSASMAACLLAANQTVGACAVAVEFATGCEHDLLTACGVNTYDFFHVNPSPATNATCLAMLAASPTCSGFAPFSQLLTTTMTMLGGPCVADAVTYCAATCSPLDLSSCQPDYGCLLAAVAQGHLLSPLCHATVRAVTPCADDIQTICPFDADETTLSLFPFACLHTQQMFVSSTCAATDLFAQIELVYGHAAVVTTVPNDVYYCRLAHQVAMAFTDGIAAGAFPAKAYGQNQFYANSGALIGLVVALSYLYPFTAHVRLIVQERSKKQRLFLMLIGVHHSAVLVTYTVIGFLTVFLASIFSTVVLGLIFPGVTSDNLFSLVFTYGFSLVGLASFVASFFHSTRHSGAIAPFILFLFSIPAFVVVGEVDWITYVLPPSVTILAADLLVGYSQSSASPEVFQKDLSTATAALFGLGILYLVLALLVEQFRIMSTSIGIVGHYSRSATDRLFGAYRYIVSPFRKTKVYHRIQHTHNDDADEVELVEDDACPTTAVTNEGEERLTADVGGGYGYENFEESGSTGHEHHRHQYNIGGVDQDGSLNQSAASKSGNVARSRSYSQIRTRAWRVGIAMYKLTMNIIDATGVRLAVKDISGHLYQNRLNCIIGGTGSGKSTMIRLLMGELAPDGGHFTIDDKPPTLYNRQNVGVCLQQDVSWDQLTVAEHIELVQLVKGCIDLDAMKEETKTLLSVLDLEEKRDCHADTLSYGMLRKLNVAMAFAGGSRVLFLDEPTASIDPLSRKAVWHLLGSNVTGRCIVVSTSYVEELDDAHHLLMLHDGKVRCSGTPQYLKRCLGGGFVLSVSRGHNLEPNRVLQMVTEMSPGAQLINNVGQELCFRIAASAVGGVGALLTSLEQLPGVSCVNISDHRLDEIFMRVTREQGVADQLMRQLTEAAERDSSRQAEAASSFSIGNSEYQEASNVMRTHVTGSINSSSADAPATVASPSAPTQLAANTIGSERERSGRMQRGTYGNFHQCFCAIINKRFAVGVATSISSAFQFLLPLICIAVAMNMLDVPTPPAPSLLLDPSTLYGSNEVIYSDSPVAPSMLRGLAAALGIATRGSTSYTAIPANTSAVLSTQLAAEMDTHTTSRYGAFVFNDTMIEFDLHNYVDIGAGVLVHVSDNRTMWNVDTVLHNTSSPHAIAAFLNQLANIRLWKSTNRTAGSIQVASYPLPYSSGVVSVATLIISIISSILLLVPFTFFPAQFVSSIVKERETGMLDTEYCSHMSPLAYWMATFTWNMLVFALFAAFSIVLYMNSQNALIIGFDEAMYTWFVLLLYGACVNSISYILSKIFRRHTTAQNGVTMFHFACGFVLVVAANAINLLPDNVVTADAKSTNERLMKLFRFLPTYALGESFIKLSTLPYQKLLHQNQSVQDMLAPSIKLMLLFPVYLGVLIVYEEYARVEIRVWWKTWVKDGLRKCRKALGLKPSVNPWDDDSLLMVDDDPSVVSERSRALTHTGLNAVDLWRRYDKSGHNIVAVQNVGLHVGRERLVIVGPNGCGKTSLLRCLAGVDPASCGYALNRSHRMDERTTEYWAARSTMGYAGDLPSHTIDVAPYMLLHIMADLRGLRHGKNREQHVQHLLHTMGLWSHRNSSCKSLSPAIRRRVAVAMSLVGYPETLVLDEPTTSLDPVGRRQLWATLQSLPSSTSLLMSSQWSEDVDMLASRVMLMDGGKMRQVGPVDELRQRARQGGVLVTIYWKQLHVSSQDTLSRRGEQKDAILEFFTKTWPACHVTEESHGRLRLHVPPHEEETLNRPPASTRPFTSTPTDASQPAALPPSLLDGFADIVRVSPANTTSSAGAGTTVEAVFARVLAQRNAWSTLPLWSSRPSTPLSSPVREDAAVAPQPDDAPSPLAVETADDLLRSAAAVEAPAAFEFDVTKSTFASIVDDALGNKCTTVQHIRRMLNLPSCIKLRPAEE